MFVATSFLNMFVATYYNMFVATYASVSSLPRTALFSIGPTGKWRQSLRISGANPNSNPNPNPNWKAESAHQWGGAQPAPGRDAGDPARVSVPDQGLARDLYLYI